MRESQTRMALSGCVVVVAAMVIGCATMSVDPTPTEEVAAALADYQAAWQDQDVDKMVAIYSEDWRNSNGVDKPWLRAHFESLVAQDVARSTLVDIGKVVVNGDRVTVMLTYDQPGPRGREPYRVTMKKEADGVWRFVYHERVH